MPDFKPYDELLDDTTGPDVDYRSPKESKQPPDPLTVIGWVLPSYYQWIGKLSVDVKEGHLEEFIPDLIGLSTKTIQEAARRVRRRSVWPKYDIMGQEIAKEARSIHAKHVTRRVAQAVGQPVVTCPYCCDGDGQPTGLVEIYLPDVINRFLNGERPVVYGGPLIPYTGLCRCCCEAGNRTSKDLEGNYRLAKFNPTMHVRVILGADELPLDVGLFYGDIEPIQFPPGWDSGKAFSEALQEGMRWYEAELSKRRKQLGWPEPKRFDNKAIRQILQQATAQPASSPPPPAIPDDEDDDIPF